MKSWTEFHIAIVYFAGLLIALTSSVVIVLYLRPFKFVINKLTEKFDAFWSGGFISTIIIAGLLGAMAVSFRNCEGEYDYLLKSENATISKGLEQVSSSFTYLSLVLGLWLIIFLILSLVRNKSKLPSN